MTTEYDIQKTFVKWARQEAKNDPRLRFLYSPPNESRRSPSHYQKRLSEGMLAGVPDLHLPYPIRSAKYPQLIKYPGLFIETKTKSGSLSPAQVAFRDHCEAVGYPYRIVRSADDGIALLQDYLRADDYLSEES